MNEHLVRIRAMLAPDQQTWDLSENDVAAIRWLYDTAASATRELSRLSQDVIVPIRRANEASRQLNAAVESLMDVRLRFDVGIFPTAKEDKVQ